LYVAISRLLSFFAMHLESSAAWKKTWIPSRLAATE
jgi:hypothetical protein